MLHALRCLDSQGGPAGTETHSDKLLATRCRGRTEFKETRTNAEEAAPVCLPLERAE